MVTVNLISLESRSTELFVPNPAPARILNMSFTSVKSFLELWKSVCFLYWSIQLISNICVHQPDCFLSCYFCEDGWQWEVFTLSTAVILEQFIQYLHSFFLRTVHIYEWDLPSPWASLSVSLSGSFFMCSEIRLFIYSYSSLDFGFSSSCVCTAQAPQLCLQLFQQLDLEGP